MRTPVSAAHLIHDELASPADLSADCRALSRRLPGLARAASAAVGPAPSILFDDYPREIRKPEIKISAAAVRLASALELHLS